MNQSEIEKLETTKCAKPVSHLVCPHKPLLLMEKYPLGAASIKAGTLQPQHQ